MKRVTRNQIRSWLAPMRQCLRDLRSGEVDAIRGYPVTRIDQGDDYARIDFCIAGFQSLIGRLCPQADDGSLARLQRKLANGVALTVGDIDAGLSMLHRCEDALTRLPMATIKSAVLTEMIDIEIDRAGLRVAEADAAV